MRLWLAKRNDCDCRKFFISLFLAYPSHWIKQILWDFSPLHRLLTVQFFSSEIIIALSYYERRLAAIPTATALTVPSSRSMARSRSPQSVLTKERKKLFAVFVTLKNTNCHCWCLLQTLYNFSCSTRLVDSTRLDSSQHEKKGEEGAASKQRIKNFVSNRNDNWASRKQRIYNCFRKKGENCHVLWIRMFFFHTARECEAPATYARHFFAVLTSHPQPNFALSQGTVTFFLILHPFYESLLETHKVLKM